MKLENKVSIVVAVCFLAAGVVMNVLSVPLSSGILSGVFAVGLSLLFVSLYKHFKYGDDVEQDERTRKVMYQALAGSWIATLVLVTGLIMADRFGVGLEIAGVLSIVFFVMVFVFSALMWYFERKGE